MWFKKYNKYNMKHTPECYSTLLRLNMSFHFKLSEGKVRFGGSDHIFITN